MSLAETLMDIGSRLGAQALSVAILAGGTSGPSQLLFDEAEKVLKVAQRLALIQAIAATNEYADITRLFDAPLDNPKPAPQASPQPTLS